MMPWLVLLISGLFETVWAVALDKSEGFTKLWPTLIFLAGAALSMGGLGYAMKEIPVGLAYAVWVGIGATGTVIFSMATGAESFSVMKMVFIAMIIGGVIGLKFAH